MWPVAATIPEWVPLVGGAPLFTYGLLLGLALVAGYRVAMTLAAPALGTSAPRLVLLSTGIVGAVGARLLPSLFDDGHDGEGLLTSGGVAYGGLLGGLAGLLASARLLKVSATLMVDAAVVGAALGLGVVRLGCLLHGCDYGLAAAGPLALVYPPWDGPHPTALVHSAGGAVVPVQALESLVGFGLFSAGLAGWGRLRPGWLGLGFFGLYSVARFGLEAIRGDADRGVDPLGVGLSTAQVTAATVFLACAALVALDGSPKKQPDSKKGA